MKTREPLKIGDEIEVLNDEGNVIKSVTVRNIKDLSPDNDWERFVIVDEHGDIYDDSVLNLSYKLSPEYLLQLALNKFGYNEIPFEDTRLIFGEFENLMIEHGYIKVV